MVSLPKSWIRNAKLKQGDELLLLVEDDSIRIIPKRVSEDYRVVKAKVVSLPRYDESFLERFIYSLFIQGLDEIEIVDKALTPKVIARISNIVHSIIGMEIIDVSNGRIILKSLASPEFSIEDVLNRMAQIIEGIFEGIVDSIRLEDAEGLQDVVRLENDTDRLYLLAVRLENRLTRDIGSPSRWNELRHLLGIRIVAKFLEEIADSLYDFSGTVGGIAEEFKGEILKYVDDVESAFKKVMKAYSSANVELAEDAIKQANEIESDLLRELDRGDISYRLSIYSLIDISRKVKSIGEVAFNRAVREKFLR